MYIYSDPFKEAFILILYGKTLRKLQTITVIH